MSEIINTSAQKNKKWLFALTGIGLVTLGITIAYALKQSNSQPSQSETSVVQKAEINAVSALGRIEPEGEVIQVAPSPNMGGAKVAELLVKEGDKVKKGQIIAILDDNSTKKAELETAQQEVKVAQTNLNIIKAGAKQGEINAQKYSIKKWEAELAGEFATNNAKIARLEAQLNSEKQEKLANIELLKAELENAKTEWQRYEQLAKDGAISKSTLDTKKLVFDTANKKLEEAKASYEKTVNTITEEIREMNAIQSQSINTLAKQIDEATANLDKISEVRVVDVAQAQAEIDKATAYLKQAMTALELTYIKAPIDGQIIKIKAFPGENIDSVQGVVELGNTDKMLVIAEVYESDISKIKLNQQVMIQSENGAFNGEIKGKVIDVGRQIGKKDVLNTDPAADVDARVVEVKIAVNPQDTQKIANLIYSKVLVKILL